MKRTLIITLEFPPIVGGIATYVDQVASSLSSERVVVLAPKHNNAKDFDKKKAYKIIRKNLYFPPFFWPRWIRLFFQVWRIVKKEHIEVIHVHHILPVGYIAWIIKKLLHIPYIIFSHGTDIAAAGAKKRKRFLALTVSLQAESIIVNSKNLSLRLLTVLPRLSKKVRVVYPCPDKDFFTPPPKEEIEQLRHMYALEGKKVILSASRLDYGKGYSHLVRSMAEIVQDVPHIVWFIIGDGPKKKEVFASIIQHNLQNNVRFIGEVPHNEVKKFYYLADIFVLLTHPYRGKEEGLGLVFLEAAAAGLPVIAGKSGGVEEAVIDKKTGMVIDVYQQHDQIKKSIISLLADPDAAQTLGAAGKKRMAEEFQWEKQIARISDLL